MEKAGTEALMDITQRPDFTMVEGHGSWLIDDSGKRYLDFVQGWAVNCLGHSPGIIQEALAKQATKLINCSPAFYNEPMAKLAGLQTDRINRALADIGPAGADTVRQFLRAMIDHDDPDKVLETILGTAGAPAKTKE